MKKSLLILGALAAMSMIFMGCPNSTQTSDPTAEEEFTGYEVDFSSCTIKDAYCGTYDGTNDVVAEDDTIIISVDSDGVLTMAGYSWDKTYITLPASVNLSKASTLSITAKVADGYTAGDAVIFELSSGSTAASGVSTWTDKTFFGSLTTDYKTFSISMDKFSNLGENSVYGTSAADLKNIKEIAINPRGAKGNIYISSIKFE
ncbi:MAG: hypothetical protein K6D95_09185 [Treponema sp.]|nr:hypothetical protein [Treponema sp.]